MVYLGRPMVHLGWPSGPPRTESAPRLHPAFAVHAVRRGSRLQRCTRSSPVPTLALRIAMELHARLKRCCGKKQKASQLVFQTLLLASVAFTKAVRTVLLLRACAHGQVAGAYVCACASARRLDLAGWDWLASKDSLIPDPFGIAFPPLRTGAKLGQKRGTKLGLGLRLGQANPS